MKSIGYWILFAPMEKQWNVSHFWHYFGKSFVTCNKEMVMQRKRK